MPLEQGFTIGDHLVKPLEGRISGPTGEARVEPKAMAVLMELAAHETEVRSREQIQDVVWPRGFVTDDALTRCIGQLRKALGDNPRSPAVIETIPRYGYRLALAPQPIARADQHRDAAAASRTEEILLVLPFQNLTSEAEEYIADGLTELLIGQLASAQDLRVISRTTSMHFKNCRLAISEIAEKTGADWVVEGSLLQSGDRVQVIAQLIDARSDAHLWADDYLRNLGDILQLQNEISSRIAAAIRLQLGIPHSRVETARSLPDSTMRQYLLARNKLNRRTIDGLQDSIKLLSQVNRDAPDFAGAWASRAEARFMLAHYGGESPIAAADACRSDVEHALTLDPDLGIAYSCRGAIKFAFDWDADGAREDLLRALELTPSYVLTMMMLVNVYQVRNQFSEARQWLEQARLTDPLDVGVLMNTGDHCILQRRFADAVVALQGALELEPAHKPSRLRLSWALALAGRAEEAETILHSAGPATEQDWQWLEYASLVSAVNQSPDKSREYFSSLRQLSNSRFVSPWSMARSAAVVDPDVAIEHLRQAIAQGSTSVPFMALTPAFDTLRSAPEFQALLKI
jgi:TolB-like protein/Flp pilus assembly protein TadD